MKTPELLDDLKQLLEAYTTKDTPPKRRLPLGPQDFPPGTVIRHPDWKPHNYTCVVGIWNTRLFLGITIASPCDTFDDLMNSSWIRLLPGTTEWLPCWREE